MSTPVNTNSYTPDKEEIVDAISFVKTCHDSDLANTWKKISLEWDVESVIHIHKALCDTGRITTLIKQFE